MEQIYSSFGITIIKQDENAIYEYMIKNLGDRI